MEETKQYKKLDTFNPSVEELNESHRELVNRFTAGSSADDYAFNDYIKNEAFEDQMNGEGVSYIVYDFISDSQREVVAYFTLRASSIPYIDRIKDENGEYDDKECGISAVEIRMFAVSQLYQDTFYQEKLIASIIFEMIVNKINEMSSNVLGVKAIYLHSVKSAESFYEKNKMTKMEHNMKPFYSTESECQGMYALIRPVTICYDE